MELPAFFKEIFMLAAALQYAAERHDSFLAELTDFLSIPSISALSQHKYDIQHAAQWLVDQATALGLRDARVNPTARHPIVTADWLDAGPDKPTVLIYGHYDVQPADPIGLWNSDPFKPEFHDDYVYARGASDDKGQTFIYFKALESFFKTAGRLPVNVKLLIEGEEEVGGPSLDSFIERFHEQLHSDIAVISDTHMLRPDQPCLVYGLRGLCYIQVEVTGPDRDLHSGQYGGAIYNPIQALCEMLSSLKDRQGHITIPGFYDKVNPLSEVERRVLAEVPFDPEEFRRDAGVPALWGEAGYSTKEQITARPTLELNGMWGGFMDEGPKTVLPSKAYAKLSCRLVANQDQYEIADLLQSHLRKIAPPQVTVSTERLHGGYGALINLDSHYMQTAAQVLEQVFGHPPVYEREGGSIPVVATLQKVLGIDSIMLGFGLPDDGLHSPNERFYLPNFYKGIETIIRYFDAIGR
jgi:acetylornithine deacetylase/succinyl-diaminopimelate desuccinylase-like protein